MHDIAWDYAQNIFVSVRNYETINGVYVVATNLNGTPIITPVGGQPFQVACEEGKEYTISLNQSDGTGTLTGAGSYASCTEVTVTATADNQYKFVAWKEGSTVVSTSPTYTFYATKNRTLTAVFEPAVYNNITWWNLFENGEDIEDPNAARNERFWRLMQVEYNDWIKSWKTREDQGTFSDGRFKVTGFFYQSSTNGSNYYLSTFMNSTDSRFQWLGDYLAEVLSGKTFTRTKTSHLQGQIHAFINRATPTNNAGDYADTYGENFNYSTAGQISSWRPFWTEKVCDLPQTMTYNDAMPVGWTKPGCSSGSIAGISPSGWYKWNNVDSEQNGGNSATHILAWRDGSPKGAIVTRVTRNNMQLHVSYVKKHIQEHDPEANFDVDPQDATNSDVFKLMYNKKWSAPWHNLTITRKIQGGMFNTVCFPFAVDLGDNGSMHKDNPFKNAEYWKYTGNTHSSYNESGEPVTIIEFVQETQRLQAGVPYLVKSDEDIKNEELLFAKEKVLIDTVPKTVSAMPMNQVKIDFIGTINPTTIPAGSLILVANNRLALTTAPGRMEGMRGYFYIHPSWTSDIAEQAADGRVYISMNKPTTTSIPVAPEAEQQVKPEVRKVMYDGKIYILRGEEVYTITGHRVR